MARPMRTTPTPILMYGPRWIKPGRVDQRVVVDIAPTLARLLVDAPAAAEERGAAVAVKPRSPGRAAPAFAMSFQGGCRLPV